MYRETIREEVIVVAGCLEILDVRKERIWNSLSEVDNMVMSEVEEF